MNVFSFNVNTIGIPNVCTAPWNLQHIKDLKMTEWSLETCSPIISSNKCCADVNNWLIGNQTGFFLSKKIEVSNKVLVILYKHDHLHSNAYKKINPPLISTSLGENLFTWRLYETERLNWWLGGKYRKKSTSVLGYYRSSFLKDASK